MKLAGLLLGAGGVLALAAYGIKNAKEKKAECIARGDAPCGPQEYKKQVASWYVALAHIFSHGQPGSTGGPIITQPIEAAVCGYPTGFVGPIPERCGAASGSTLPETPGQAAVQPATVTASGEPSSIFAGDNAPQNFDANQAGYATDSLM